MNSKRRETERRRQLWRRALQRSADEVRERVGPSAQNDIPNGVLLAEVEGYLPTHRLRRPDFDVRRREQWFAFRLMGFGRSEREREWLAQHVASTHRAGAVVPWGLMSPSRRSRRSEEAGRRRNSRRLAQLR